jgi:hypothetical protein
MARSQPIAVPGAERGSELEPFSAPPLRAAGCQAFDEIDFSGSRIAFLATKKRQTFPAREYLCDFSSACGVAVRGAGPVVHDLRLDGAVLRLRFAGPALVPFVLPPLAHLRSDAAGEQPVLTVDFWDAASTGVYPPPYPLGGEDVPGRGAVRAYDNAGVRAVFHSGVDPRDGHFTSITVYDEEVSTARYFVLGPDHIQEPDRAAPLRAVLHWVFNRPDRLLVHAGAVGINGRAVLLTGPGGSGKSTSAVAAFLSGYDYLGDDYVLVDLKGPQPVVHSLYATAKLGPHALTLLPGLSGTLGYAPRIGDQKRIIDVSQLRPGGLGTSARIEGIVVTVPSVDGRTVLRRASAGAVLRALAPSTIFQAPEHDGALLGALAQLARRVPAYVLELGGRPDVVGSALSGSIGEVGTPTSGDTCVGAAHD